MDTIAAGLSFPEGPRWHAGALYFSDFYTQSVHRLTPEGVLTTVAVVERQPSGLGWLPDGRLLVVSMLDRRVLRQEPDGTLVEHADLSAVATWHCNDMVVDGTGRAYVGNFGFDTHGEAEPRGADLSCVLPDGQVSVAARDLQFPNGTVVTPDGQTLVIGETRGRCLTAFDIAPDGTLSGRREWADLGRHFPDGIALDAEGAIWVADPRNNCVIRVHEGGHISARFDLDRGAYACALGGEERRTLYVCAATGSGEHARQRRDGQILAFRVDVPGAGWP
ncbi:MAG: SMP-30/gluconolactonase/LRE family protein [Pseudomonadota bacterium]